jgi:hypothetical protein
VLFNNKLLTRDNLEKRRKVEDLICLFCKEKEAISHLFFDCVAARQACLLLSEVVDFDMGLDYETMSKCWLCNTKFGVANVLSSAVCLGIWKLRNSLCFQNIPWKSMKQLSSVVIPMLRCWRDHNAPEDFSRLRRCHRLAREAELQTDAARAGSSRSACT